MANNRFIYLILSAFISGNLLIIYTQFNSGKNINNLIIDNEKLLQELNLNNQLREAEINLLSVEGKIRGAIATDDTIPLSEVEPTIIETETFLDSLKRMNGQDSMLKSIDRLYEIAQEKVTVKNLLMDTFYHTGSLSSKGVTTILTGRLLQTDLKKILKHRRGANNEVNELALKIYNERQHLLHGLSLSVNRSGEKARWLSTTMILLVLGSEAILFWYIIIRIRRQNQLIQQLNDSERKVREVSMIKENFMANISHEIRTPMNAILGFTYLLKNKKMDNEAKEFVDSIYKSGENLLTIINDILDFSKIQAGMVRIESIPFNIREINRCVQALFKEKFQKKGLNFSVVVDESIPDTLSGDATRLTQILMNTIGNAFKFTDQGSVRIEVKNQGRHGNYMRLSFFISDTGVGIAQEKLSGIFERFGQAEDSTTRKYGGTGLGLSIVKELVLLQNGELDVQSEPGKGTNFMFTIPYEIIEPEVQALQHKEIAGFDIPNAQNIHILVVEDNEMNQNLLRHLLYAWKFSFDIVSNGIEAIQRLKAKNYDLILMDIQMPDMDGYVTAQDIRLKLKIDAPIIAITANAFAGEREKCLGYGMNEYIAKPINPRELLTILLRFLGIENVAVQLNKKEDNGPTTPFKYINLQYMFDISNGNRQYEKTVTEQFLQAIPSNLESLQVAFAVMDIDGLRKIAHTMKTNVSVMGLTEQIQPFLDALEYESFDANRFQNVILSVKAICTGALTEAQFFYSTLLDPVEQ